MKKYNCKMALSKEPQFYVSSKIKIEQLLKKMTKPHRLLKKSTNMGISAWKMP